MFCKLKPSATDLPCVLRRGVKFVTAEKIPVIAEMAVSMLRSMGYEFGIFARPLALLQVSFELFFSVAM